MKPDDLTRLVEQARDAAPNDRIELRDAIAAHGLDAVDAMAEWLADPALTRFAVRVVGRVAEGPHRTAPSRPFGWRARRRRRTSARTSMPSFGGCAPRRRRREASGERARRAQARPIAAPRRAG